MKHVFYRSELLATDGGIISQNWAMQSDHTPTVFLAFLKTVKPIHNKILSYILTRKHPKSYFVLSHIKKIQDKNFIYLLPAKPH
jgi:hypothetical protein